MENSHTTGKVQSTKGASKQRRDLINAEITRLRELLPVSEGARNRLGQLQVMSITNIYIRKCTYLASLFGSSGFQLDSPFEFTQALTGFLLVATRDGKLLYLSDDVTEYLGHSMVDLLTQSDSLYDIVDRNDHACVQTRLLEDSDATRAGGQCSFLCRMNISRALRRQSAYGDHKVMHVKGYFTQPTICDQFAKQPVLIATCSPLITPDVREWTIPNTMVFHSVHGLDMKYIEIAANGEFHLGYSNAELCGRSWYSMLHPDDLTEAAEKHMQLVKSYHEVGCLVTVRLNNKDGWWVWANVTMHIRQPFAAGSDPAIVCINQIISESDAEYVRLHSQLHTSHTARSPEYLKTHQNGGGQPHTITMVTTDTGHRSPQSTYSPSPWEPGAYAAGFSVNRVWGRKFASSESSTHFDSNPGMYTLQKGAANETIRSSTKEITKELVINQLKRKLRPSMDSAAHSPTDGEILSKPAKIPRTVIEVENFDTNLAESIFSIPDIQTTKKVETALQLPTDHDVELGCSMRSATYNMVSPDILNLSLRKGVFDLDILEDQVFTKFGVSHVIASTSELTAVDNITQSAGDIEMMKYGRLQQDTAGLFMKVTESNTHVPQCTLTTQSSSVPVPTETKRPCTPDQTVPVRDTAHACPSSPESLASPVPPTKMGRGACFVPKVRLKDVPVIQTTRQLPKLDNQYVDNFFNKVFDEKSPQTQTPTPQNHFSPSFQSGHDSGRLPNIIPSDSPNTLVATEPEVLCAGHREVVIWSENKFAALTKSMRDQIPGSSDDLTSSIQQHPQPSLADACADSSVQSHGCPENVANGGYVFLTDVQIKVVQEILGETIQQPSAALDCMGNPENGSFDQCTL